MDTKHLAVINIQALANLLVNLSGPDNMPLYLFKKKNPQLEGKAVSRLKYNTSAI